MSLNPFSAIEKLINERGSANIMKERLALAGEQFAILEKENASLRVQLEQSAAHTSILESQIENLQAKIKQMEGVNDELSEPQEIILQFLYKFSHSVSIADVIRRLGISFGDFEFHVGELVNKGFVNKKIEWIAANEDNMGDSHNEVVGILQAGRAYLMKKKG